MSGNLVEAAVCCGAILTAMASATTPAPRHLRRELWPWLLGPRGAPGAGVFLGEDFTRLSSLPDRVMLVLAPLPAVSGSGSPVRSDCVLAGGPQLCSSRRPVVGAVLKEGDASGPISGEPGRQDAEDHSDGDAGGAEQSGQAGLPADPDYRFTLANERTFLAWFRTSLALIASGVAVVQLVPEFAFPGARHALGVLLTIGGGALAVAALRRWQLVQEAMRREEDLPPTRIPAVLGIALAVLTVFVVVLLALSTRRV